MSTARITIDKEEYTALIETNTYYKELLDSYDAIKVAEEEKGKGTLQTLTSLSDLI